MLSLPTSTFVTLFLLFFPQKYFLLQSLLPACLKCEKLIILKKFQLSPDPDRLCPFFQTFSRPGKGPSKFKTFFSVCQNSGWTLQKTCEEDCVPGGYHHLTSTRTQGLFHKTKNNSMKNANGYLSAMSSTIQIIVIITLMPGKLHWDLLSMQKFNQQIQN